jgi:hypothetical protein
MGLWYSTRIFLGVSLSNYSVQITTLPNQQSYILGLASMLEATHPAMFSE